MASNHVCLECGVSGVTKDLIYCANCCAYAIHRYCMDEWPKTKHGRVFWSCGCQELPNQPMDELSNDSQFTAKDEKEKVFNQTSENEQIDEEISNQLEEIKKSNLSSETSTNTKVAKSSPIRPRFPVKFMKSFTCYGNLYGPRKHAEPIIRSIWSGSFQIRFMYDDSDAVRELNEITAFLSNKVDEKAWDESVEFGPVIGAEMVLKDLVWPDSFGETGPKDEDIAVYFFASAHRVEQQVYNDLVFEMMRDDLAMRIDLENAEILIFTSVDLIPRLRKFQGKWYLWGVFRQKHRSNDEHDNLSGPDLCSSC